MKNGRTKALLAGLALIMTMGVAGEGQEKPPALNISGVWDAAVVTDQGSGNPTFDFKQNGTKVTGTYKGLFGRSTLEGKLEGQDLKFSFKAWSPLSPLSKLNITYTGVIDPATMAMKGKVDFDGQGTGTWTAKRHKD
jgi:hypothetical protein